MNSRFKKIYTGGSLTRAHEIWVDTRTGVNYLYMRNGNAGGLTPLLGRDGKPVITPEHIEREDYDM